MFYCWSFFRHEISELRRPIAAKPEILGLDYIKRKNLPITWHSFAAIGRRNSEISRRKKRNVRSKAYDRQELYRSGRPIE